MGGDSLIIMPDLSGVYNRYFSQWGVGTSCLLKTSLLCKGLKLYAHTVVFEISYTSILLLLDSEKLTPRRARLVGLTV